MIRGFTTAHRLIAGRRARGRTHHCIERARRGTAHRLHRADDRHLCPGRQGHGQRLPDVSRRARRQARRHGREVHRRGRPGQARRRRHQGQEARAAGQGAHVHRRRARLDRLRAGAGVDRNEDHLHRLDPGRRRSDAAAGSTSIPISSAPAGRRRSRTSRYGQWACDQGYKKIVAVAADYAFGYEQVGGFQKTLRGLRRQNHPEDLAAARHQGLRPLHPDHQGRRRRGVLA